MPPPEIIFAGWVLVAASGAAAVLSVILLIRARNDLRSARAGDDLIELAFAEMGVHQNQSRIAISVMGVLIGWTLVGPVSDTVRDAALIVVVAALWLNHVWSAYVWRRRIERLLELERVSSDQEPKVVRLRSDESPADQP